MIVLYDDFNTIALYLEGKHFLVSVRSFVLQAARGSAPSRSLVVFSPIFCANDCHSRRVGLNSTYTRFLFVLREFSRMHDVIVHGDLALACENDSRGFFGCSTFR